MIIQDVSIDANSKKEVSVFWYESEYAIRNSKIRKKYSKMKKKKKKMYFSMFQQIISVDIDSINLRLTLILRPI